MSNNEFGFSDSSTCPSPPSHPELDQTIDLPVSRSHNVPRSPDTQLLQHPIFNLQQEKLLSSLLSLIKPLLQNPSDIDDSSSNGWDWLELLMEVNFGKKGIREIQNEFKRLDISYNKICGKLLSTNDIFFRCLDCDRSRSTEHSAYTVICGECFEKSNHKGHRVLTGKADINSSRTCGCGDASLLNENGFCVKHNHCHINNESLLAKLPSGFLQNFLSNLKKAFYNVFVLFEMSDRVQNQHNSEALSAIGRLAMEELLLFCTICYAEINGAMVLVLEQLLRSPLLDDCNNLWHDCNLLKPCKPLQNFESIETHKCTCTLLGLLFRFGNKFDEELQMKLYKILLECAKEKSFKAFLSEEFTKYIQFFFNKAVNDDHFEGSVFSNLLKMKTQLYANEELCEQALKKDTFDNLISIMKKFIQGSYEDKQGVYKVFENIISIITSFLNKNYSTSKKLLTQRNIMEDMLEIIFALQLKTVYRAQITIGTHEHQVDYDNINYSLRLENLTTKVMEQSFELISEYPQDEKIALYNKFLKSWGYFFNLSHKNLRSQLQDNTLINFNIALERSFVSSMLNYPIQLRLNEVSSFMNQVEDNSQSHCCQEILKGIVKRFGTIRYLHLIHDLNFATGLEAYYRGESFCFEKDILGIQLLSSVMTSEDLFKTLAQGFFSYENGLQRFFIEDIKAITSDDHFRTKLTVMEDFLNFLVFIMNDEICNFNLSLAKTTKESEGQEEIFQKFEKVVEKVLINTLLGHYWVDLASLKRTLSQVLKSSNLNEEILEKLIVIDPKTRKIRIKDQYKDEFDPYLFYRMPGLQREITHAVAAKTNEKEKKNDLVSGKFYVDVPEYLSNLQKNLYESSLPEFLSNFIKNFNEELAPMVRPVLKLILTHLQIAKKESQEIVKADLLAEKIDENYLNFSFVEKLLNLPKLKDLNDCETCVNNIQVHLKVFACRFGKETLYIKEEVTGDNQKSQAENSNLKKNMVAQRMQQLKEEFMKKQKLFMNKNSHLISEDARNEDKSAPESPEHQAPVCQYCLEHLDEEVNAYGIPIYVGFTNNFHDTQQEVKFKRDDHPEKLKGDWWPVISSCMHYYHNKCFNALYINSRASKDQPVSFFSNRFETNCTLCKTVCNSFLTISKNGEDESNISSSTDEQERGKYPDFFMSFPEKLENLLHDLRKKLANRKDYSSKMDGGEISADQIVLRAYIYFLESFHLLESSKQQKRACQIQENFCKVFLQTSKKDRNIDKTENITLFERLYTESVKVNTVDERVSYLLGCQPEKFLNEISFHNLIASSLREINSLSQTIFLEEQLRLLKEYLIVKAIQRSQKPTSLDEFFSFCRDNQSTDELFNEVKFPIQKHILATYLNQSILFSAVSPNVNPDLLKFKSAEASLKDINDALQSVFGSQITLDSLIRESVCEFQERNQDIISLFKLTFSQDLPSSLPSLCKIAKFAPKMMKLPKTYAEFNSSFIKKKCSRCNQYSKNLSTCLCLICGKVVCQACCHTSEADRDYGNLNKHARKYHLGTSLFLEVQRLTKTIIASPINAMYPGEDVYVDQFGQSIQNVIESENNNIYSIDFKKFTLNPTFVQYMKDIVNSHGIAKEAFMISKVRGFYYNDNIL